MNKIKYPDMENVESNIKLISELFENHIQKMSDEESEEFSSEFYEFIDKVKGISEKYNLNPDSMADYYKGHLFLQLSKSINQ